MNIESVREQVLAGNLSPLIDTVVSPTAIPWLFEQSPQKFADFRSEIAGAVSSTTMSVIVVGSGRFGYSLSPDQPFRLYRSGSDIDLALVDEKLFDEIWHLLLEGAYPRYDRWKIESWLNAVRDDVYTGWFYPGTLKFGPPPLPPALQKVLERRTQLFSALVRASNYCPRRHRGVKARLFRTHAHVRRAYLESLIRFRDSILPEEDDE